MFPDIFLWVTVLVCGGRGDVYTPNPESVRRPSSQVPRRGTLLKPSRGTFTFVRLGAGR